MGVKSKKKATEMATETATSLWRLNIAIDNL